jgi:hypothetical protein
LALLRPAFNEIVAFVIKVIEERPGDGFEDGRLARAVRATDGDDAGLKAEVGLGVVLDVFEFDACDLQGRKK